MRAGNIATEAVVNAAPDGHTLLLGGAVNAINATLYESLPSSSRGLRSRRGGRSLPNVMTVSPSFPVHNVADFIAYARAHPGKLNQGSSGNGTTQHLAGELFKMMTGTDFAHIPYKGASGHHRPSGGARSRCCSSPCPPRCPHHGGQVARAKVTSAARAGILPEVPTIGEYVPDYEASGWTGVCAPGRTPPAVIGTLNAAINAGPVSTGS